MNVSRKSRIFFDTLPTTLGILFFVFSGERLAEIRFENEVPSYPRGKAPEVFIRQLREYFEGTLREFHQSIVFLHGTDFEQDVWLSLRDIPYGETRTYKWIAERIGNPKAVRAVGQALSRNPIPIVLPCHRIIESDGSIGGYSSGIERKRRLLDMEYYYSVGKER